MASSPPRGLAPQALSFLFLLVFSMVPVAADTTTQLPRADGGVQDIAAVSGGSLGGLLGCDGYRCPTSAAGSTQGMQLQENKR